MSFPISVQTKMKTYLTVLLSLIVLSGCATQEYKAAESQCAPQAYRQYPVINQRKIEMRTRPVEVPTRKTKCVSKPKGNQVETICEDITETRYEQYPYEVTVDVNADTRNNVIRACARNICFKSYGNVDCETKK